MKLPEIEAFGEINFYNSKTKLKKTEFWSHKCDSMFKEDVVGWSDAPNWTKQIIYKKGERRKITNKTLILDERKIYVLRTEKLKYKRRSIRGRYRFDKI